MCFMCVWRWGYPSLHLNTKIMPMEAQFSCPGASPPLLCTSLEAQHKNVPMQVHFRVGCLSCTPCRRTCKMCQHVHVLRVLEVGIPIPPPEHAGCLQRLLCTSLEAQHESTPAWAHFRVGCLSSSLSCTRCHQTCKMCPHGHVFRVPRPLAPLPSNQPCPSRRLCTPTLEYENTLGVFVFNPQHHKHA